MQDLERGGTMDPATRRAAWITVVVLVVGAACALVLFVKLQRRALEPFLRLEGATHTEVESIVGPPSSSLESERELQRDLEHWRMTCGPLRADDAALPERKPPWPAGGSMARYHEPILFALMVYVAYDDADRVAGVYLCGS